MSRSKQPPRHAPDAAASSGNVPPELPKPPCGCEDPTEGLKRLFVDYFQARGLAAGRDPATRPVFLRLHGVAHGTFVVRPDLPRELRIGVFGQKTEYPAWVRFSSDLQPGLPDLKGTIGVGIKLFGVEGKKLLSPDEDAPTQDFVFQNHDVFFVDDAKEMCDFTCLSLNGRGEEFLEAHPATQQILDDMEKVVPTVLGSPFWSVLPFRFGKSYHVKYKLEPEEVPPGSGEAPDYDDPSYLRADLHERLKHGEARFRFMVQFQTNDEEMPLDRATVRWSEEASPPVHVATLVLPRQDLGTRGQSAYGENLAFNTWHVLAEHEPVGSLAQARKVVYRASAEVRRNVNGVPLAEPVEPRPAQWRPGVDYPEGKDTVIVRAAIHPAIGIARMGNSPGEFFYGPEVTEPAPQEPGFYRDSSGALKRQAARFRIYGYNAAGEVVRELTPGWADIRWTVHVANRKAAWYRWMLAMDIPEAASLKVPLRNAAITGDARRQLVIDGGARSIEGTGSYGSQYRFQGEFMGTDVYLGELRTDEEGRLVFLGGHGKSASPTNSPIYDENDEDTFINADGWYDDASDGPVTAEVTIQGRKIPVEPAWVVTAPPNYAPDVVGVRTLYDLLYDLFVQGGWFPMPERPSFRDEVYPVLHRLSNLQWVNKGFAAQFGWGGPSDFENPDFIAKLSRRPAPGKFDTYGELRRQVFNSFRNPAGTDNSRLPWPWIYGDAMDKPPTPRENATISPTQYRVLQLWAAGQFEDDWNVPREARRELDEVPLQEQPEMLTKAALHFCLADAFHPGCEVTWPIRHLTLFSGPFRVRHRPAGAPDPEYGPQLTQAEVMAPSGPLHAQGPGDLTRWMGLPWQADTAFCRAGYETEYDPYLPTFWPARVPNEVLSAADYARVVDETLPREERLAAFSRRETWTRLLRGGAAHQMEQMVSIFGHMGVVEVREGVADDPELPPVMMVESAVGLPKRNIPFAAELLKTELPEAEHPAGASPAAILRFRAIREAGWESEQQAREAAALVRTPY